MSRDDDENEEILYYIVEFSDGIQLIPYNWLNTTKTKAYWPSFTNIKKYDKAVQSLEPVGKNWILCDVLKIVGSARSFESGKKRLKKAENYSDLNTDVSDNEKLRKIRAKKDDSEYCFGASSDSETAESSLQPFPKLHSYSKKSKKTILQNSNCKNVQTTSTDAIPCTSSQSIQMEKNIRSVPESVNFNKKRKIDEILESTLKNNKTKGDNIDYEQSKENSKENMHCISTEKNEFEEYVIRSMIDTKYALKRCENILKNIVNKLHTSDQISQKEDSTVTKYALDEFPIADLEAIQTVENELKTNDAYRHSVVKMLSMVGGIDLKSITLNILTRTLTNTVAARFSWLGGKKKLIFSELYLWKIILNAVRQHIPNAIESDIIKHIKIWLAHATERVQREERRNKNKDVETNINTDTSTAADKQMPEQTALQIALEKDIILTL